MMMSTLFFFIFVGVSKRAKVSKGSISQDVSSACRSALGAAWADSWGIADGVRS